MVRCVYNSDRAALDHMSVTSILLVHHIYHAIIQPNSEHDAYVIRSSNAGDRLPGSPRRALKIESLNAIRCEFTNQGKDQGP